jgi:ZIP family zinc transporter
LFHLLGGNSPLMLGLLGGLVCALFNLAGATPVLLLRQVPQKMLNVCLGFSAGILLGSVIVTLADQLLPHMHLVIGYEGTRPSMIRGLWLFVIAITIHNMPEGLAVGAGFGSGNIEVAILLMLAIGLQNVPEGLSVGFSLLATRKYSRRSAYLTSALSGFVEPPLALIGAFAVSLTHSMLPYAMGFAAGAMLFVISDEIIPETHRKGHERIASYGLITGLVVILALDLML